jgi:hypothetical protein
MNTQEKYEYWLDIAQARKTLSQTKEVFARLLILKP